jgi:hypothetical protein
MLKNIKTFLLKHKIFLDETNKVHFESVQKVKCKGSEKVSTYKKIINSILIKIHSYTEQTTIVT